MKEYGNSVIVKKEDLVRLTEREISYYMRKVKDALIRDIMQCMCKYDIKNPDIYLIHKSSNNGDMKFGWYIGDKLTLQKRVREEKWVIDSSVIYKPEHNIIQ